MKQKPSWKSYLNESMITGESTPVQKVKGQKGIAGSINGNGSIKVTVSQLKTENLNFKLLLIFC